MTKEMWLNHMYWSIAVLPVMHSWMKTMLNVTMSPYTSTSHPEISLSLMEDLPPWSNNPYNVYMPCNLDPSGRYLPFCDQIRTLPNCLTHSLIMTTWYLPTLCTDKVTFDFNYCLSQCLHDTFHVQGKTQDPPSLHLDSIARHLGLLVLDAQKTQKVIPPKYHDFLPLFLEEGSQCLPPKRPDIDHGMNVQPDLQPTFGPYRNRHQQDPRLKKNS
jgi:hypothetical protein